jgi:hypothetical protein
MALRFHFTPVRMAIIKKTSHKKWCWWKCKLVQSLQKLVWSYFKKLLKIELPYDPAIPLLGIYLKECEATYNRDTSTSMAIAALFTTAKLWNQPKCPKLMNG